MVKLLLSYFSRVKLHWKDYIALSLIPQIIIVQWFARHPDSVEKYYSEGIYPIIAQILRVLFGWIPFSMGDIFYTALVVLLVRFLIKNRKTILKKPWLLVRNIGFVLALFYFIFHFFWGLNYHRLPIAEKLLIEETYTQKDLESFTKYLISQTNTYQLQLTGDSTKVVQSKSSKPDIFKQTLVGYEHIAKSNNMFAYRYPSIKKSIYSLALTYMGYGGYLNPFTNEAQVNGKIPKVRYPTVSAHEIGHQIGYSAENETNFIGYLVTVKNEDPYFKYAAYSHSLGHCLNAISRSNPEKFKELYEQLHPGAKKNYQEIREFWENYQNPLEPVFKKAFDTFLKANKQTEGIESYDLVVGLLINYHKKYAF